MLKILIVEDAPNMRARLVDLFTRQLSGYEVLAADNRNDAIGLLAAEEPDMILLDLVIPPNPKTAEGDWQEGREVLRWIRKARPQTWVIVLSAMGYKGDLVRDFLKEENTDDFFTKDEEQEWRSEKVIAQVEGMLGHLVSRSPMMRALRDQLAKLSERDLLTIIQGEAGSGKEYLARIIHNNSPHARSEFIRLPILTLRPNTLLSDLMGKGGEFSGRGLPESLRAGTLFIDGFQHVGMMDSLAQAHLASLLDGISDSMLSYAQPGGIAPLTSRFRLVFSTTIPLDELHKTGSLTPELYAALCPARTFVVPPLTQRQADLAELLDRIRRANNITTQSCPKEPKVRVSPVWSSGARHKRHDSVPGSK